MKNILYINSCVRDESRTHELALEVLRQLGGEYDEVKLDEAGLKPLDRETLEKRTALIEAGDYSDSMFDCARQLAAADIVVISAPYWDLSFPAALRTYIENIYVTGIVSEYAEDGTPKGLCRGQKLYYVTTAGGPYLPAYSYDYLRDMFTICFGFEECELISAEMLDVVGCDARTIIREAKEKIDIKG
jgi:FMN-dependent NADH-azoreductase